MPTMISSQGSVLGYSEPLIDLGSFDFLISIAKVVGWLLIATVVPLVVVAGYIAATNWCNFDPGFYDGTKYHGAQLVLFAGSLIGGAILAAVIVGFTLFWSFLGMLAAFSHRHVEA